ncbi:MAG: NYN domain-containing protein, partial [Gemmatimonadota bacterium]
MSLHSYTRAPHVEGAARSHHHSDAPNAALLIDFDNVTMGMRSDLSKELKNLLNSDIIRGKVTVQRAYADWRRYPQYIVPLSEASIDLIFAPAYGSSKKNATDIRMAIDGMELVFIRPEIGTYILLTGDSDFSSLVLKLKEYGKYVIGVGIQESSSDILVQNCDEYYSYTSLTGLRKSGDSDRSGMDPWMLVEKALEHMNRRNDVMRSDRLKQVMLELDAGFDEGSLGFSKFSRFLTEASSRGLVRLKRMENGQYELSQPSGSARRESEAPKETEGRKGSDARKSTRSGRSRRSGGDAAGAEVAPSAPAGTSDAAAPPAAMVPVPTSSSKDGESASSGAPDAGSMVGGELAPLAKAYDLLRKAMEELGGDTPGEGIRDSDVKRKMLAMERGFDEAEYGFSKFSRFLRQAHDHGVLDLTKTEDGNYHVTLKPGGGPATQAAGEEQGKPASHRVTEAAGGTPTKPTETKPAGKATGAAGGSAGARRLTPRVSSRRGGRSATPPPLLEGQIVGAVSAPASSASSASSGAAASTSRGGGGPG